MRYKNNQYNSKNHVFIVGFIVIAIVSVIVCVFGKSALDKIENKQADTNQTVEITTAAISDESSSLPEETTPQNQSPLATSFSQMCKELTEMNVILDKYENKTHEIDICDLAQQGDLIESFIFRFYSEDGVSNMGNVKGGFGISIDSSCPAGSGKSWYDNKPDFSVQSDGASCEVTWVVPKEIREYINFDTGKLMFGYWWSDVTSIRLDNVICKKSTTKKIPFDGEKKVNVGLNLPYSDSDVQKFSYPISSIIEDGQIPEFFSIQFTCSEPVDKFRGSIGISTNSAYDKYYTEKNVVVFSGEQSTLVDWFIPEEIVNDIDINGNIDFIFDPCIGQDINIDFIYVQYKFEQ